jgi:hypothetical protein
VKQKTTLHLPSLLLTATAIILILLAVFAQLGNSRRLQKVASCDCEYVAPCTEGLFWLQVAVHAWQTHHYNNDAVVTMKETCL